MIYIYIIYLILFLISHIIYNVFNIYKFIIKDLAQYKELNTEFKKIKDAHSEYVTRENEREKKIKKINSNTELSEEEKEKIIEEAQEEFNQFEYGFFKWGMAQDMVIK